MNTNFAQKIFTVVILLFPIILLIPSSVKASSFAPLNPAFVEHMEKQKLETSTSGNLENFQRGRTPSSVNLSHLKTLSLAAQSATYPESYDLRELGHSTPIKNQNPYGTCWTFGTLSSLESTWLKSSGEELDLSELHMAYFGYSDTDQYSSYTSYPGLETYPDLLNNGGDDFKATALLSRWTGAVLESDSPYAEAGSYIPTGNEENALHLQHVIYLTMDSDTHYSDLVTENVKHALTTYGTVAIGMLVDEEMSKSISSDYYNADTFAMYIPESNDHGLGVGSANHEVSIVGWDDNYSLENFSTAPPADGAWIVKNSWGTDWGDQGYFYMSYYDAVGDTGAAYIGEKPGHYRNIYQYDFLGWVNSINTSEENKETAWLANLFTSKRTEMLKAVSFYAAGVNNTYEISITEGIDGPLLYGPQRGTLQDPGYHTVEFDKYPIFEKGQKLAVKVKLTTPGYNYPVAVEFAYPGFTDKADATPGQSYVSTDGINWTDTTTIEPTANVCLKAFSGPFDIIFMNLEDVVVKDLTSTPEGKEAINIATPYIEKLDPREAGIAKKSLKVSSVMDYRSYSGKIAEITESQFGKSSFKASAEVSSQEKYIFFLIWNYESEKFDIAIAEKHDLTSSAMAGTIEDGGVYESPSIADGHLSDVRIMQVITESENFSDTGCSLTALSPFALLLLLPLLTLTRKGK